MPVTVTKNEQSVIEKGNLTTDTTFAVYTVSLITRDKNESEV